MATLQFNAGLRSLNRSFVPLGTRAAELTTIQQPEFTEKINYPSTEKPKGFWCTLGWEDDRPFVPAGELQFSANGNLDEGSGNPITEREIDDLKAINPRLSGRTHVVRERYINFDDLEFDIPAQFNPAELPRIRMTLFLQPDEGALVYYQHSKRDNHDDADAIFEYILPESPGLASRDRLNYFFPVTPKKKLVAVDEDNNLYRQGNEQTGISFIVKVLTYKQKMASEEVLYSEAISSINRQSSGNDSYELVGKDKYQLLIYRSTDHNGRASGYDAGADFHYGGEFVPAQPGDIRSDLPTLLLIHGTFVDTVTSFRELLKRPNQGADPCYLQKMLTGNNFGQILAFDHPTISHGPEENVRWLLKRMKQLSINFQNNPLNIITTSRGALVAEFIASDKDCKRILPVQKVLMFSAANGCGYFSVARVISKAISFWRNTASGPAAKVALALAQLSVEFFINQPGCVAMTINHKKKVLENILRKKPNNPDIIYKCVVSDWHNCLVKDRKWFARAGQAGLDITIRIALGKQHDWVIGASRQEIVPHYCVPKREASEYRHAVHGRYLEPAYVNSHTCTPIQDPHQVIHQFFA